MNPKHGCSPNRQNRLREEEVAAMLENPQKKCGHIKYVTLIYENVILPLRITKMPLWTENVGPMTWTG